jgi:CheY-like chemotaxis protein
MPIHVLLVEDNRSDVALVCYALKRHGLEATIHVIEDAESAGAYLSLMGTASDVPCPEIVIMDLNLPRGDGLELLRQIRSHQDCRNIPAIVMTSSDAEKDRATAIELGNTRFFRKPPDLDAFLHIGVLVREILEDSRGSAK